MTASAWDRIEGVARGVGARSLLLSTLLHVCVGVWAVSALPPADVGLLHTAAETPVVRTTLPLEVSATVGAISEASGSSGDAPPSPSAGAAPQTAPTATSTATPTETPTETPVPLEQLPEPRNIAEDEPTSVVVSAAASRESVGAGTPPEPEAVAELGGTELGGAGLSGADSATDSANDSANDSSGTQQGEGEETGSDGPTGTGRGPTLRPTSETRVPYPREAWTHRWEATCAATLHVDDRGRVRDVTGIECDAHAHAFGPAFRDHVRRRFRFTPALVDGQRAAATVRWTHAFSLETI